MSKTNRVGWVAVCGIAALLVTGGRGDAQSPADNPYRPVRGLADGGGPSVPGGEWAKLPGGREMGPPASVHVDVDGESIWAFIRCDETSPVPVGAGRPVRRRLHVSRRQAQAARHDLQVRSQGQRRQKLWRADVHLAARHACRPRRQRVGDRCGRRRCRGDGRQGRRESRPHRPQVQSGWKGADDAGRTGRRRKRRVSFPLAGGRRDGSQWRYFRRGRPRLQQPHREVFEGRKVHQGVGQDRICAGRVPGGALHRHGQEGASVRVRSGQYPDPDLRPGRQAPSHVAPVRNAERDGFLGQRRRSDLCVRLRSPTMWTIPVSSRASGSATRSRAG